MREAFICDGIRTPIGRYGGALSGVRADDLAAIPLRELLVRNPRLDAECIDDVILGCANQAGEDNRNVARMATLLAGLPQSVSGTTINRLCGSGLDALGFAARAIKAGDGDLLIAGGVESMSRAPFVMGKATSAFSRQAEMFDTTIGWRFVNPLMAQQFGTDSMPETAENVAELLKISRQSGRYHHRPISQNRRDPGHSPPAGGPGGASPGRRSGWADPGRDRSLSARPGRLCADLPPAGRKLRRLCRALYPPQTAKLH